MRWPRDRSKMRRICFALAEAIEEHGERANIHGVGAEPDQMGMQAGQLVSRTRIHCARSGISSCSSFSTARQ